MKSVLKSNQSISIWYFSTLNFPTNLIFLTNLTVISFTPQLIWTNQAIDNISFTFQPNLSLWSSISNIYIFSLNILLLIQPQRSILLNSIVTLIQISVNAFVPISLFLLLMVILNRIPSFLNFIKGRNNHSRFLSFPVLAALMAVFNTSPVRSRAFAGTNDDIVWPNLRRYNPYFYSILPFSPFPNDPYYHSYHQNHKQNYERYHQPKILLLLFRLLIQLFTKYFIASIIYYNSAVTEYSTLVSHVNSLFLPIIHKHGYSSLYRFKPD